MDPAPLVSKEKTFSNQVLELIDLASDICKQRYEFKLSLGSSAKLEHVTALDKFRKLFTNDRVKPAQFYSNFEKIYNALQVDILNTLRDDTWLHTDIVIRPPIKRTDIYLDLSNIFQDAQQLQPPPEANDESDLLEPEPNPYPLKLQLYLLRIFHTLGTPQAQRRLAPLIVQMERSLKLPPTIKTAPETPAGDPIAGLFGFASNLMRNFGVNLPENFQPPNSQQVMDTVKSLTEKPEIKQLVTNITQGLASGNPQNIGDTIALLQNQVNPETMDGIRKSVEGVAQQAGLDKLFAQLAPSGPAGSNPENLPQGLPRAEDGALVISEPVE